MKRSSTLILGISLLLACEQETPQKKESYTLAWISKGKCKTFFDLARSGAKLAEEDLNTSSQIELTVSLLEPDDCSGVPSATESEPCLPYQSQIDAVSKAITDKVQGIALTVADPTCVGPSIDRAVEAGIPVITFDSDAPDSQRSTYFGIDNKAAALKLMSALDTLMGGEGSFLVFTSMNLASDGSYTPSTSSTYQERLAGIEEYLGSHPKLSRLDYHPCLGGDVTDHLCADAVEASLQDHPEVKGIFFARGKLLREENLETYAPTLKARRDKGDLAVVAFDAPVDALPALVAGYSDVTVNQKMFGWGYDTIGMLYDKLTTQTSFKSFTDSGWDLICKNNIAAFQQRIEAEDFRTALPECKY